jgi:subtilisin-like proprotein convertase family protein
MMLASRSFFAASLVGAVMGCGFANAQTYTNSTPISIPDVGNGAPYPSSITIAGGPSSITYLTVTLNALTHSYPGDIQALLVAPGGQKVMLMSGTGGGVDVANLTLVIAPDAPNSIPSGTVITPGIYRPTMYYSGSLGAPAPAGPYSTDLAGLIGTNANGTWNLYIFDSSGGDSGSLATGWSINLNGVGVTSPLPTSFTYQGQVNKNGSPISGMVNARYSVWDSAISQSLSNRLFTTANWYSYPAVANGLITQTLDLGSILTLNKALWLEIEIESPPGSGFTTLTPRQPLTTTPVAGRAIAANTADSATLATTATNATTAATATNALSAQALTPGYDRWLSDKNLYLHASPDILHGLGWYGAGKTFASHNADGPVLFGQSGGVLGSTAGGQKIAVAWDANQHVGVGGAIVMPEALTVQGNTQINTKTVGQPNSGKLAFGTLGNLAGTAENSDAVYFVRDNWGENGTLLYLMIGDDPLSIDDGFVIATTNASQTNVRFSFRTDGVATKPGGGSWSALSDPRAKHDTAPLAGTLDRLLTLRGYSFLYNDDAIASGLGMHGEQIGLMADEVERVFPSWVSTDRSGMRMVTERATTALMVEALRDLRSEKDAQLRSRDERIGRLEADNAELKSRLERLESLLGK